MFDNNLRTRSFAQESIHQAPISLFATEDQVANLELRFLSENVEERIFVSVELAWHLRQRAPARALALVEQVHDTLSSINISPKLSQQISARTLLIRGEIFWLNGEIEESERLANLALQSSVDSGDAAAESDAFHLLAWISEDLGNFPQRDYQIQSMESAASLCDVTRVEVGQAWRASFDALTDVDASIMKWKAYFQPDSEKKDSTSKSSITQFLGLVASFKCDFVQSIKYCVDAYHDALYTGQIRRAVFVAGSISDCYVNLNDYSASLEWLQRCMDLSRDKGWPICLGRSLFLVAASMRRLRRYDHAYTLIQESLSLISRMPNSRQYAIALRYLGDIELDRQQFSNALPIFEQLEQRAIALNAADLHCVSKRGQAQALLHLNRQSDAVIAANAALKIAKSNAMYQIAALRVLADLYQKFPAELFQESEPHKTPLDFLKRALSLAESIQNYFVPSDLLDSIASEYANIGDYAEAYRISKSASINRDKIYSSEVTNRASAMEISHQTEKIRVEAEFQSQLAKAEAEKINVLLIANATLEHLAKIGREIIGNLNADAVFSCLDLHLRNLVDSTNLHVYQLKESGNVLRLVFGQDSQNKPLVAEILLNDQTNPIALYAQARQVHFDARDSAETHTVNNRLDRTQLMSALQINERLLGIMVIQSTGGHVFSERECAIVETLCAYGSIAMANAEVQEKLLEKNQLLEQLAVKDRLTGLFNRLKLDQILEDELVRSRRYASIFSVVLLDVDHFKSVNDNFGHPVGDQVLKEMSNILEQSTREVDIVGRWGGEEFMIICPDTDIEGAYKLAEKLRLEIASHLFQIVGTKTASFGVAGSNKNDTPQSLLTRVDEALYRSKKMGRNRVEQFG
ncbi:GGDEF domain-containing protein [Undibacterium sp. 5I1]|uniref:tetratricopeptide repeat-containing diguanylate cyclase n=1 Tax=unclassified Undibacterium TaxID=2630295 RepID=UPI002AB3EEC2|nr:MULTISPECIES: GGDEF domain-containing protein [unclassified Undibacterium]MDY7537865.1 GGDEF domain-containing protein [Undibacterium sp. 5I1]MEB0232321.1 GGDEF domain-containing protein [Undibacterium sp. 10I3]MEB0259110.1 GGDEF domain-containing protein [Undibacterium sp. 5I1]